MAATTEQHDETMVCCGVRIPPENMVIEKKVEKENKTHKEALETPLADRTTLVLDRYRAISKAWGVVFTFLSLCIL